MTVPTSLTWKIIVTTSLRVARVSIRFPWDQSGAWWSCWHNMEKSEINLHKSSLIRWRSNHLMFSWKVFCMSSWSATMDSWVNFKIPCTHGTKFTVWQLVAITILTGMSRTLLSESDHGTGTGHDILYGMMRMPGIWNIQTCEYLAR